MNKNIEVINENLWVVNFNHIELGYIKELSFEKTTGDDFMTITEDGKIILNKAENNLDRAIEILTLVMLLPDDLLGTKKGFYSFMRNRIPQWAKKEDKWIDLAVQYYNLDKQKDAYNSVSAWEKERRKVKADYIKRNKTTGINKIMKIFRRKGV